MTHDNQDEKEPPTCFFCADYIMPDQSMTLCIDFGEVHTKCHDAAGERAMAAQHEMGLAIGRRD